MVLEVGQDCLEIKEGGSSNDELSGSEDGEEVKIEEVELANPLVDKKKAMNVVSFTNDIRKVKKKPKLTKRELRERGKEKQEKDRIGLTKPDIVKDRAKERELKRIATTGVAQLFNAVSERQRLLDTEIKRQKGNLKDKERLRPGLNLGAGETRPKKEEVDDWLKETMNNSAVKEEEDEE